MKKCFIIFLTMFSLMGVLTACGKSGDAEQMQGDATQSQEVSQSIHALTEKWEEIYSAEDYSGDKHLEIRNTRIVHISEDTVVEDFQDMDYIVEFILFSDYFGSAPYYENIGHYDCVVVYKDGSTSVEFANPFSIYRAINYAPDFSGIIESVVDYGDDYNQVIEVE